MAQTEGPKQDGKESLSFRLICSAIPLRIMTKGPFAMATAIPIHFHVPDPYILHRFIHLSPTLKGCSSTIRTLLRSLFHLSLDIGQFQYHNGHGELLASGVISQSPSYKRLALFSMLQIPTAYLTDTLSAKLSQHGSYPFHRSLIRTCFAHRQLHTSKAKFIFSQQ